MKLYLHCADTQSGHSLAHSLTLGGIADHLAPLLSQDAAETFAQTRQAQGVAAALDWFHEYNDCGSLFADDMDSFHWDEIEVEPPQPSSELVLQVEGGVVHAINGIPPGLTVKIVDYDTDGVEPDRLTTYHSEPCVITTYTA